MTFATLLKRLQRTHYPDGVKSMADALGIHPTRLYRAMQPGRDPFDIRGCLRLALVTGADLLIVLQAAGKSDVANDLAILYSGARPQGMTPARQHLHAVCDRLTEEQVRTVSALLEVLVGETPTRPPRG